MIQTNITKQKIKLLLINLRSSERINFGRKEYIFSKIYFKTNKTTDNNNGDLYSALFILECSKALYTDNNGNYIK